MDFTLATYRSCRQAFRQSARAVGARQDVWRVDEAEDLTIDVARLGPPEASKTIIVSSGLHGVEGVFGSYVQQQWMQEAASRINDSTQMILMHGLNPFGFSHRRRCDRNNVDLNRAFFDLPHRPPTPELYEQLDRLLNPAGPPRRDAFLLRALVILARYGRQALSQAIAAGQYTHPQGLFFGGQQKSSLQHVLESRLLPLLESAGSIEHFDLHTGLGKWCELRLLMQPGIDPAEVAAAKDLYGPAVVPPQSDVGYRAAGTMGEWLQYRTAQRAAVYRYFCVELGTFASLKVLRALRDENRAWFAGGENSKMHDQAGQRLQACFQPDDPQWQTSATEQTLAVLRKSGCCRY